MASKIAGLYQIEDYNCAGYAFDIPEWLFAYSGLARKPLEEVAEIVKRIVREETGKKLTAEIIPVGQIPKMKFREELIVMRIAPNRDFHFVRRFSNNKWFHKCGGSFIRPMKKKEVFGEHWKPYSAKYDSDFIIFREVH